MPALSGKCARHILWTYFFFGGVLGFLLDIAFSALMWLCDACLRRDGGTSPSWPNMAVFLLVSAASISLPWRARRGEVGSLPGIFDYFVGMSIE